jgi:anti-sigma-K factor RskA
MSAPKANLEDRAQMLRERVENGLDVLEEYGGPLLDRYGRAALVVGVGVVAAVAVALVVARRRRRKPLTARLHDALPDSVSSRIDRPLSSIRAAADRITR